ncbi:MAG: glycosyltransferase family 4 protein [Parabacteroides sp.]|nr:glycosyltransferase family 4 protein [Parabacteroides sp.]
MKHIYLIINEDRFFLSHRKEIAINAKKQGYEVTLIAKNTGQKEEVEKLGINFIELPINPTGENIREELKTFFFLYKLYRKEKPNIVHHVGLKNILWGGLAAKLAGVQAVVNAVSGLGILFNQEKLSLKVKAILNVLRFSHHRKKLNVIFQNNEDKELFLKYKIIKEDQIRFIKGSGVDLNIYSYTPEPQTLPIKIIFTARMVVEKGTLILIEAAELLRKKYEGKVQFLLCGGLSSNPKAIKENELKQCCDGNYIQWLGHRKDIKELLQQSHIVAFPSYYREGVPKSLIEATAIGRPIITTNSIGCKDTVEDGQNGFLVPIKNSQAVAEKLEILIENQVLRQKMGAYSRMIAERDFSLEQVVKTHLDIYKELLK